MPSRAPKSALGFQFESLSFLGQFVADVAMLPYVVLLNLNDIEAPHSEIWHFKLSKMCDGSSKGY